MAIDTMMLYGESGTAKTTNAWLIAKYIYEKYGLLTKWVSTDGGGWKPVADEGAIELGIVDAVDVRGRAHILADMRKICKGWWPQKRYNDKGQRVRLNGDALPITKLSSEDAAKVGLIVIEGMASLGEAFKSHIAQHGAGIGGGTDGRPWTYEEDDEVFGGVGKQHYGMIQQTMYDLAMLVASLSHTSDEGTVRLPNLKMVVWTSLVGRSPEGASRRVENSITKYGPQIAGTAVTTSCPQWLGDCLHLHKFNSVSVEAETNIQSVRNYPCAFFLEHPDPETGIPYLAKPRVAPSSYHLLLEEYPGGYVKLEPKLGVDEYLRTLDRLASKAKVITAKWKREVDKKRGSVSREESLPVEVDEKVVDVETETTKGLEELESELG